MRTTFCSASYLPSVYLASVLLVAVALVGCGDGGGGTEDGGRRDARIERLDSGTSSDEDASSSDDDASVSSDAGTTSDAGAAADPSAAGPLTATTVSATVTRGTRMTPVTAHLPALPAGETAPLIVFLPGFQLESTRYAGLADRLASHGFVVVRADPPAGLTSVNHVEMAADAIAVIDWAVAATGPLAGRVDPDRIAIAGHSLGGKVATMAAADDARVDALLAIDPVNGGNPFTGYSATLPDIVPEVVQTLTIPVGFMGETTNSTGGLGGMACAPADQNFATFYDAATGASWAAKWDFTGADHMDFVGDTAGCGFTCSACTDGPADDAAVLAASYTVAVAFARRHLRGEVAMDAWLTGASVPAIIVDASR